jgi:acetyl-CoA C-acetyltransferase
VVELHDAVTIGEIVTLQALGLTAESHAPAAVAAGELSLGGPPVNPSGGLISRRHPLGATAVAGGRARLAAARRRRATAGQGRANRTLGNDGRGIGWDRRQRLRGRGPRIWVR